MSSPLMIQIEVVGNDNEQMTTWVEKESGAYVGAKVFLKEPKKWYTVTKVYEIEVPKDHLGVRGFKNNI